MPRVASQPMSSRRPASRQIAGTPHKQSPMKLALNDDRGEKAARLQSRQALQELQLNEIRAAATGSPMRKFNHNAYTRAGSESPQTPRMRLQQSKTTGRRISRNSAAAVADRRRRVSGQSAGHAADDSELNVVANSAVTPMKRVPILANFEEWMKLATDNKINATNSWNFALIDYFHDMSLLKEGDGVNFQKASCTLDGCVKIYTSRVDSVATETGRLLPARSHEATLAPSFASLQLKKLELEFAVDPLFKKASADFDEGGAKGLLLNHLSIDSEGRIVFDSSDDAAAHSSTSTEALSAEEAREGEDVDVDLASLAARFFPDLSILDSQDICPSMKTFTLGSADLTTIPFIKGSNDKARESTLPPVDLDLNLAEQSGIFLNGSAALGFDGDDDEDIGGFDMPDDVGFGEGGEAWARDAAIEQQLRTVSADGFDDNGLDDSGDHYAVSFDRRFRSQDEEQENLLAYFDKAFNSRAKVGTKAFMTLENWRIQKLQKGRQLEGQPTERRRKEKEPFEIDFTGPMSDNLCQLLEAQPVSNSSISLPKAQWKTKGRNLLDRDDEQIDVRKLMRLWIKPKCRVGKRKDGSYEVRDEGYGSRGQQQQQQEQELGDDDDEARKGDYDANFFQDDDQLGIDGVVMDTNNNNAANGGSGADAHHQAQPPPGSFGSQLVTQQGRRLRPEYVNYARTAKKVDVRRLKEEMWKGMADRIMKDWNLDGPLPQQGQDEARAAAAEEQVERKVGDDVMEIDHDAAATTTPPAAGAATELKFTTMISDLTRVYPVQQMKDISTVTEKATKP
ncbi:hypothetical protein DV738_g4062, partial [Chaetothyriales sp. CBS 135597]